MIQKPKASPIRIEEDSMPKWLIISMIAVKVVCVFILVFGLIKY